MIKEKIKKCSMIMSCINYIKKTYLIKHIDKNEIYKKWKMRSFSNRGGLGRDTEIIVSLTTFPARINDLKFTLYSLLDQTITPEKIIVWLSKEEFKEKNAHIPKELLNLESYGIYFKWCDNQRSYNKLIPALKAFPNKIIVTVDDDIFYDKNLIYLLRKTHADNPMDIVAHRVHRVGLHNDNEFLPYNEWEKEVVNVNSSRYNFLTGVGGVLYPPGSLSKDVVRDDIYLRLAPYADDIWFWAMAVLNNRNIVVPKNSFNKLCYVNPEKELLGTDALATDNVRNGYNDTQLKRISDEYPKLLELLKEEV